MAHFTAGKVIYARTTQPAQYESKKAEAEIAFAMAEGEDGFEAMQTKAFDLAVAKVHEILGIAGARTRVAAEPTASKAAATETKPAAATPPKRPPATSRTKADLEAEKAAELAKTKPAADPTAIEDDVPEIRKNPEDRKPAADPAAVDDAMPADDWNAEAPAAAKITDQELTALCTRRSAELQKEGLATAAVEIRKVIGKYGTNLIAIAQEKRAKFVEEIKAMKAK